MLDDMNKAGVPTLFVRLPTNPWRRFEPLQTYMDKAGASYLDLADPEARPPYELHFRKDGHIDERGHEFVATRILKWFKAHGRLDCED